MGDLAINFFQNLVYNESLYYLLYSCTILIFGKNYWDMDQNALGQSDCGIFISFTFIGPNSEIAWFLKGWYKFMKVKSWLKNTEVGVVKNGCGHSGSRTLNLAVSLKKETME